MSSRKADEVNVNIDAPGAEELCDNVNLNSRQIANKYEAAIVAAMEARRLNDITRVTGESLSARVTQMAIENVRSGRVTYCYEEPKVPADSTEKE